MGAASPHPPAPGHRPQLPPASSRLRQSTTRRTTQQTTTSSPHRSQLQSPHRTPRVDRQGGPNGDVSPPCRSLPDTPLAWQHSEYSPRTCRHATPNVAEAADCTPRQPRDAVTIPTRGDSGETRQARASPTGGGTPQGGTPSGEGEAQPRRGERLGRHDRSVGGGWWLRQRSTALTRWPGPVAPGGGVHCRWGRRSALRQWPVLCGLCCLSLPRLWR